MSTITAPLFSFKSGVLSKKLLGRQDLSILKSGLLQGHNFITQVQGPQEFRAGFNYVRNSRHNLPAQLWQFIFNDDQAFVLEFTDYFLRFYTLGSIITETAKVITALTAANPGVFTSVGHGFVTGDEIFLDTLVGPSILNGQYYYVVRLTADTFSLQNLSSVAINTSALPAYASGGTAARVYEIATPYTKIQAESLKIAGTADIRYLVDGVHMPRKLTRTSNTSWTLVSYIRTEDPYTQLPITGITQANPARVTVVAHGRSTGDKVFLEDITGMTQINNRSFTLTKVDADNYTLDGVDSTAYTAYVSGGISSKLGDQPRAVGLYGAGLFFGGSDNDPDVFNKSRAPDPTTAAPRYDDFTLGNLVTDAVTQPISPLGESIARIRWFLGTRDFLGTGMLGGMAKINGGQDAVPIANGSVGAFPIDSFGVADIVPVPIANDIIYAHRSLQKLMSFIYSLQGNGFQSFDVTIQSDEIALPGVRQLMFQDGNPALIWILLNNGSLLSLTYLRTESLTSFNTHAVGSPGPLGVISMAAEPRTSQKDNLWICVERIVGGNPSYMIEVSADNPKIPELKDLFTGVANKDADEQRYLDLMFEAQRRSVHLDNALTLDTTQVTTITPAAVSGSSVIFTAGTSIFVSTDIGRIIRIKYLLGGEVGIAQIVGYTSGTVVTCKILEAFASTAVIPSGAWYFTKNVIKGLGHAEGLTVTIMEDGAASNTKVVTGGQITLDDQCCVAVVGQPYVGILETMPIELLLNTGVTPGKYKTISLARMLFRNTLGPSYGQNIYNSDTMKFRSGADISDRPAPLFSNYKDLPDFDGYDIKKTFLVVQTQPFPCTVQSLVLEMEVPFEAT